MAIQMQQLSRAKAQEIVSELFNFITAQGDADYIGEAVSQLQHSLQAAHLAVEANADEETILGALLHDIGRFVPDGDSMPAIIAVDGTFVGRASHEVIGERYLRQLGFSEKICALVGAHVMAKRYLTAVDNGYYDSLSQSSKTTLKYQGGIFDEEQVREAQKDPWLENKLAVRRWDDAAKDPSMTTRPLAFYEDMAVRNLLKSWPVNGGVD
jgi:2-amino-1-hydroxyethylphosphonate dioxygenase (glycine-forming)